MSSVSNDNLANEDKTELNEIDETNSSDLKVKENKNALKSDEVVNEPKNETKTEEGISSWFSAGTNVFTSSWMAGDDSFSLSKTVENTNNWGVNWLQSAKEKTLETIEFMKKDLNEFSDTVQHEASSIATVAANSVKKPAQFLQQQFSQFSDNLIEDKNITKTNENAVESNEEATTPKATNSGSNSIEFFGASKWVKSFVETVQKLGMEDTTKDESNYTEELRIGLSRKCNLEQYQLIQTQNDERTYLYPPSQNIDLYREWLLEFKITEHNGEINMLLGYNPKLREIYSRLVPSKVDNHTFWNRYFFKIHILELDKQIIELKEKMVLEKSKESNNESGERDETWSLCSSTTNLTNDEMRCLRNDLKTPLLETSIKEKDNKSLIMEDEWVKCNDEENNT